MTGEDSVIGNSPLNLVVDPPMSHKRVLHVSLAGFGLVVCLVLIAGYLGYYGSDRIQDTAQALVREHIVQSDRATALEAQIVRQTQDLIEGLGLVLGLCFLLAAGTATLSIWIMRRAFAKLDWQAAELAHVSWHMIDGHEKMARRFSHEMHDELGQSLSGLRRMLSGVSDGEFHSIRSECVSIVDEVLQNVRKLSQVLRPVILDDFGIDQGLRWLCERFSQRTGIHVNYNSNVTGRFAEAMETHLFRITQEALTNIARHSGASQASVNLTLRNETVYLTISDDGKGLDSNGVYKGPSLGMVGIRARARQLNGELLVENRREGGLRLQVKVPLQKEGVRNVEQEDPSFVG